MPFQLAKCGVRIPNNKKTQDFFMFTILSFVVVFQMVSLVMFCAGVGTFIFPRLRRFCSSRGCAGRWNL